jgi:GT2 family glycosyltransferase
MASRERRRPIFSVVLSTLGNHDGLRRVLDGYSAQTVTPDEFEVIIAVDVAEKDHAAVDAAIGRRAFAVRKLSPSVPGLSANRNAGWRAAAAPIVLFTDNDTIPVPELVAEHLASHHAEPDEEAAVVGNVRWSPEVEITTFMRWLDTGLQFNFTNLRPGPVPWGAFAGANSSLKVAFIERIGDFDEEGLPYLGEDTDFAYRGHKLGMQLFYNDRARVDHLRTMSFELVSRRVRRMAAAEYELSQKHPELEPWWHEIFTRVLESPPARGRGVKFAPYVPRGTPWLGRKVWSSVDLAYKQALAPYFVDAWDEAVAGRSDSQPRVEELLEGSETIRASEA